MAQTVEQTPSVEAIPVEESSPAPLAPPVNRGGRPPGGGPTPGSWTPGTSGNRSGRPRGFVGVAAAIGIATNNGEDLVKYALEVWRDTKRPHAERWMAFVWLSDRGLGKPMTSVELTVHAGDGIKRDWSRVPLEERVALLKRLREVPALEAEATEQAELAPTPSGDPPDAA